MTSILWLLLIISAADGYGLGIVRVLKIDLPTRLERFAIEIGLGTGAMLTLEFILGLLHLTGRVSSLALVLPAAAFAGWKAFASLRNSAAGTRPDRLSWGLLAALGICMAANVAGALAPPSFVDALFYHLFIPQTYLRAGGIVELPAIWQSYQPLGVEMLFTLGMSLHGDLLAALIHAALGILAAAATCLLGRRIAGAMGGLVAAAIFYCTALIAWESTSCFIELGTTAFSTLAFYALLRWSDDEDPRWLLTVALLMAFSGMCKLTAIQFPMVAALLVFWTTWRRRRGFVIALQRLVITVGIPIAFSVPWYIHSYLWTGNPVYPFATRFFGSNLDYDDVWYILSHYGPGHGASDLLLAPWRLFSSGALFECGQYLNPLPLILAPLILWRLKDSFDRLLLAIAVGICFVLWLASAHIARYLIPLVPLAAVLAAEVMCQLARDSRFRRRLMISAGVVFIGFGTLNTLLVLRTLAPVIVGRESADDYLRRTAVFYAAYRQAMADVPENGLILTNQGATYYLARPHVRVRDAEFVGGREHLLRVLGSAPFTHIFIHGQPGVEEAVAALGPRVKLLWHREDDMALSRTFGDSVKASSFLFQVVR